MSTNSASGVGLRPQVFRGAVALGMAALLLPLAQVEALAQQVPYPPGQPYGGQYQQPQYPEQPQYSQPQYASPYPQNQPYNGQYAPGQQGFAQQPAYGQKPPDAGQRYADAGPGGYEPPNSNYGTSQPVAQAFSAEQLEEMLAPIALYPDALLAQVLAAATYPDQVSAADQWLRAQGYASTDQIAASAEGQNWDPSVKALTAFPQVLAQMNHNLPWTTDVGNAYYNDPRDVMQTVQVLRQRAQSAGTLQNTPQEAVNDDQGNIELAPPDPQTVYVPSYNPWNAYGQPISPYPGFSLLGALQSFAGSGILQFGLGIAMNAFSHTGFGWLSWALDWLGGGILFNHSSYASQSMSVAHWGSSRGSYGGRNWASNGRSGYGRSGYGGLGYERGQYGQSRDSYGRQNNPAYGYSRGYGNNGAYADNRGYTRPQQGYMGQRPTMGSEYAYGSNRGYAARPENAVRPAFQDYSYNRSQERMPAAVAPRQQQAYARPGYSPGYYGGAAQNYSYGRSGYSYASPQQTWRSPSSNMQRGGFEQRAYAAPTGRGFMQSAQKQERSGGFHLFGGGGSEHYGGGKAPKSFGGGGGKHSGGGGGHSSSHGGGGHHH